jgi:hypothetical protein
MRGIFFCESSLLAICNGSVSPSRSTRTGAFILEHQPRMMFSSVPNLKSSGAQNPSSFVFGHVRRCRSLLGGNGLPTYGTRGSDISACYNLIDNSVHAIDVRCRGLASMVQLGFIVDNLSLLDGGWFKILFFVCIWLCIVAIIKSTAS